VDILGEKRTAMALTCLPNHREDDVAGKNSSPLKRFSNRSVKTQLMVGGAGALEPLSRCGVLRHQPKRRPPALPAQCVAAPSTAIPRFLVTLERCRRESRPPIIHLGQELIRADGRSARHQLAHNDVLVLAAPVTAEREPLIASAGCRFGSPSYMFSRLCMSR